jgi:tetratricopeptide (TPR) repeat protein/anti-sigma regulatory factor (Ser/Thr protein kinase)
VYKIVSGLRNDTLLSEATYSKGVAFFFLGHYDSALAYWNKAIDLFTNSGNQIRLGDCLQNIGQMFEMNGNYIKANENYQRGLQIFEQLNAQDRAANMMNIIGSLNKNLENFDIAEKHYKNALDIYNVISVRNPDNRYIQLGLGVTYNNLGMIKSMTRDSREAIVFFEQAKARFIQLPDSFYLAFVLHNLGSVYSETGDYKLAEKYFDESSRFNRSFQNVQLSLMTLSGRAAMMLKSNQPQKAMGYYRESLAVAESLNMTSIMLNNWKGMSEAYKKLGDYQNSLIYFEKYSVLQDSLLTQSKYKQIMELQTLYETEKKEKIITNQDKQLRQQIFLFSAIFLMVLIVFIVVFFVYRTREIRKRYKLENSLNLSTQQALISQMNPHFIFNALNSVQLYILKNDKISSNLFLTNFADLIRKVLENSQYQLISLFEELEALKTYMELEKSRFSNKFSYEIVLPENMALNDYLIPTMILQPFIENSIWHGFSTLDREGKIRIEMIPNSSSYLLINIEDNGIGREKAKEIMNKNGKTRKTHGINIVGERFRLYNMLNKTNIRFEYTDLYDPSGVPCGTRVSLYLQQIQGK